MKGTCPPLSKSEEGKSIQHRVDCRWGGVCRHQTLFNELLLKNLSSTTLKKYLLLKNHLINLFFIFTWFFIKCCCGKILKIFNKKQEKAAKNCKKAFSLGAGPPAHRPTTVMPGTFYGPSSTQPMPHCPCLAQPASFYRQSSAL